MKKSIERKTVLFISQSFYPQIGGVSSLILNLSKYFSDSHFKVVALHFKVNGDEKASSIIESGIEQYRVNGKSLDPKVLSGYATFKEILYRHFHGLEKFAYKDMQDVPGFTEYTKVIEGFKKEIEGILAKNKIDYIYLHDYQLLPCLDVVPSHIQVIVGLHFPLLRDIDPTVLSWLISRLEKIDATVVSTPAYVEPLVKGGLSESKIRIIPPVIDSSLMERKKSLPTSISKLTKKNKIVTYIQRFDSKSGQKDLIKAFHSIARSYPNIKLVLVGEGSFTDTISNVRRDYYHDALNLTKTLGMEDSVIFTGNIPYEQLAVIYKKSDIVVSLSKMECYGLSITEATNYAKPVMVTNVGGLVHQVKRFRNGYVVRQGNIEEIRSRLEELIKSKRKRIFFGLTGYILYKTFFSKPSTMRSYMKLFN